MAPDGEARGELVAADIMSKPVASIREDAGTREAVKQMVARHISGLLVVNAQGTPCGVVSTTDLMRYQSNHTYQILNETEFQQLKKTGKGGVYTIERADDVPVRKIMTSRVTFVGPDEPVWKLSLLMHDKKIHRVFVGDERKIVGVVSTLDLARALWRTLRPYPGGGEA